MALIIHKVALQYVMDKPGVGKARNNGGLKRHRAGMLTYVEDLQLLPVCFYHIAYRLAHQKHRHG